MALLFLPGVRQISLSTPGVSLPLFSVTRFTASAFAENERVSSRCKADTLPQRFSFVAFTILAWSRRTFSVTWFQLMDPNPHCEKPHQCSVLQTLPSALLLLPFLPSLFVTKTRRKSAYFRRE
jgi:hypothetical protein